MKLLKTILMSTVWLLLSIIPVVNNLMAFGMAVYIAKRKHIVIASISFVLMVLLITLQSESFYAVLGLLYLFSIVYSNYIFFKNIYDKTYRQSYSDKSIKTNRTEREHSQTKKKRDSSRIDLDNTTKIDLDRKIAELEEEKNKVNVNSASVEELELVDGIFTIKAQMIVMDREVNGRYKDIEDFLKRNDFPTYMHKELKTRFTTRSFAQRA